MGRSRCKKIAVIIINYYIQITCVSQGALYICTMKTAVDKPARKPILSVECVDKDQKALFDRVAAKRGIATAALVRLLLLDEARRLNVE